ncbi:MAG TPA: M24 family metallopeptidase [Jatrophihabitantaceae bacterium]
MTDWTPPVDVARVIAERTRRATTAMGEGGVATAVFVSSGRHLFTDMDPVIWLTGFKPMLAAAVVVTADGERVLYAQGEWEAGRARQVVSAPKVVAADDPFAAAAADLSTRSAGQRVGTAGARKLNAVEYRAFAGHQLAPVDAELDDQARSKDELELAQFRRASEISQVAFDSLRQHLRIGLTDVEAEAIIERRLRELGADDAFVFLSASTRNRAVQRPWGRVLMPGDILLTELSPCVGGVFAQICRTVAFGTPSEELQRDHAMLVDVMAAGVEECRAGQTVSGVVAAMDAPFVALGMEQYTKPPFMRVRGHGMGFGSVAPGDFLSKNTFELQAGDSFVLHPNQMMPGAGYLMCGEPVIVGESAGEIVTGSIAGLEIVEA